MEPRRVIAHLDCDAFYATVELTRRPELKGKPLIVAGSGPRAVVTTASYEARRFGVGSAMPISQAYRACPHGAYVRPDMEKYAAVSREVMEVLRQFTDAVVTTDRGPDPATITGLPLSSGRRISSTVA